MFDVCSSIRAMPQADKNDYNLRIISHLLPNPISASIPEYLTYTYISWLAKNVNSGVIRRFSSCLSRFPRAHQQGLGMPDIS